MKLTMKSLAMVGLLLGVQGTVTGCDSREKNEMTIEVEAKDVKGKVTKVSGTFKHTELNPVKSFKMMTPKGEEIIWIRVANHPTPENRKEAYAELEKYKRSEVEDGVITLSEYNQKILSNAAESIEKRWKPRTKRTETLELEMDGEKIGTAEVTVY